MKGMLSLAAVFVAAFVTLADALPPLPPGAFTLVQIPDTQCYHEHDSASRGCHVVENRSFSTRVRWIAENIRKENIVFVSHTGDITDSNKEPQWEFAEKEMRRLDGIVPYAVAPGNHDQERDRERPGVTELFAKHFPCSRYLKEKWYAGAFPGYTNSAGFFVSGDNANSCQLFEAAGRKFVVLHLENNAPEPVMKWADSMLEKYRDRAAIVATHVFLGYINQKDRTAQLKAGEKERPKSEQLGIVGWTKRHAREGRSPKKMWLEHLSSHPNLFLVICGDQGSVITEHETLTGAAGNRVDAFLADYPKNDGSDWLRLFRFEPGRGVIEVFTYSPQADRLCDGVKFWPGEKWHRFTIPMPGGRQEKTNGPDYRPPFDKSDWLNTVSVQVNPWFPLEKPPRHAKGGPNVQWISPRRGDPWGEGMELTRKYGIDVWSLEINEPGGWTGAWRELLDAAARVDNGTRVGMFFGMRSKTPEESVESMKKVFHDFREDLRSNRFIARAGGHPVMVVYNPHHFKPEEWGRIFSALDAEFGRIIYLLNYRRLDPQDGAEVFESRVRAYLPYFDGVSNYGSHGIEAQRIAAAVLSKVKADYPGKIFEGGIHSTYTCHFQMGGLEVPLSRNWRDSVELFLSGDLDSVMLTNLFDHYENSLVYPCYEREDFLLRYLEWTLSRWKGRCFRREKMPEIVLTNPCMRQLGWQPLEFEVVSFPSDAGGSVKIAVELCDAAGKVLHRFPQKVLRTDDLQVETFSVPTTDFPNERGVLPRLVWEWKEKKYVMPCNPMTLVSPSMRGYRMYWARSTKNVLDVDEGRPWTMDGVAAGGTRVASGATAYVVSELAWKSSHDKNGKKLRTGGHLRHGLRRDGLEFEFTTDWGRKLECQNLYELPAPGGALHWYELEIENAEGCRFRTLPIWETDGARSRRVKLPVWKENDGIAEYEIEEVRVPFWYYPCDVDCGSYLLDASGYHHDGYINGSGFGGGHLGYTGYNHYHRGPIKLQPEGGKSRFRKEGGRGFLHFEGEDYAMLMGGTAFPGAFTYEAEVRAQELGRKMGVFGTWAKQFNMFIAPDGRVAISHGGETVVSKSVIAPGSWTRIAATYDLRKLCLYVNGELQGSAVSVPDRKHEWLNHVVVGAQLKDYFVTEDGFRGDLRNLRITGRNLSTSEFLEFAAPVGFSCEFRGDSSMSN